MKKLSFINKALVACSVTLFSQLAWSHGGHDHSASDAGLIHLLWLAPVIIAAAIAYHHFSRKAKASQSANQDKS